jgi:hypothetical protein
MNYQELKKLISKYIDPKLQENLVLHKNILYQIPVSDFLKGFCFEQSGYNKEGFYLWCFVQPLYIPSEDIVLTFGKRIATKKVEWWDIEKNNESKITSTFNDINNKIKNKGLVYIEELSRHEKFYEFCKKYKKTNVRIWEALVYTGLYKGFPEADKEAELLINYLQKSDMSINWIKEVFDNLKILLAKNKVERNELIAKFREFTMNNLQLSPR